MRAPNDRLSAENDAAKFPLLREFGHKAEPSLKDGDRHVVALKDAESEASVVVEGKRDALEDHRHVTLVWLLLLCQ